MITTLLQFTEDQLTEIENYLLNDLPMLREFENAISDLCRPYTQQSDVRS